MHFAQIFVRNFSFFLSPLSLGIYEFFWWNLLAMVDDDSVKLHHLLLIRSTDGVIDWCLVDGVLDSLSSPSWIIWCILHQVLLLLLRRFSYFLNCIWCSGFFGVSRSSHLHKKQLLPAVAPGLLLCALINNATFTEVAKSSTVSNPGVLVFPHLVLDRRQTVCQRAWHGVSEWVSERAALWRNCFFLVLAQGNFKFL
jgi:hypothetical protein